MTKYWIGVAARAHVMKGKAEGFAQLGHGKPALVKRLGIGDWIAYYAPRERLDAGAPVQAFVALGQVTSEVYQVEQAPGFCPYRRDVAYLGEAHDASIRPMLAELSFIPDARHWGMVFRRGAFAVPEPDFTMIARAMGLDWAEVSARGARQEDLFRPRQIL
ncbi:EVE domain-containing protein [Celeribacter neptunius]|uniref:UPF0310 protein SAMN04487991_0465 n=1 Tax=Celeribacter neptunius TaxID=588602 RepID=A0A1I3JTV9_9RHOB|nr:EVE domain-containing protein [Celeribacter neptunius]SFI63709.1 EVE domain-containing protein [Celeribacter neptunius]